MTIAEWKLRLLGSAHYWIIRSRFRAGLGRMSAGRQAVSVGRTSVSERVRAVLSLARKFGWVAAGSLLLWVALEVGARVASAIPGAPFATLTNRVTSGSYGDLLSAGVGAVATFLGLYWATVGVVASTVYQAAPAEVRSLFIEQRSGTALVRGIVYALNLGLLLLAADTIGVAPPAASLIVFAALCAVATLRLVVLGSQLFNFFDLSQLGRPLPARFRVAVRRAAIGRSAHDGLSQSIAHEEASRIVELYESLTALITSRRYQHADGPTRLARQLLLVAAANASMKNAIPTSSRWWSQQARHQNWLTMDHTRLSMSLATATGPSPELVPDHLWVERSASASLRDLLAAAIAAGGLPQVVAICDSVADAGRLLSARFQVLEALELIAGVQELLLANGPTRPEDANVQGDRRTLNDMAAAERSILLLTNVWLGFISSLESLLRSDLPAIFEKSVSNPHDAYLSGLPRDTTTLLADIGEKIGLEVRSEGHRISPNWWVSHYAARSVSRYVRGTLDLLEQRLAKQPLEIIAGYRAMNRPDLAVVAAVSTLELVNKMQVHISTVQQTFERLHAFRKAETDNSEWVTTEVQIEDALDLRDTISVVLGELLPTIAGPAHNERFPDLYGQVHQNLAERTFEAIIEGRVDTARSLFAVLLSEVDRARNRIMEDLQDRDSQTKVLYSVEPVVAVMELSGYAALFQEVNGEGIWDDVVTMWETLLPAGTGGPAVELLVASVNALDGVFAITTGGLMRSERAQRAREQLRQRGLHSDGRYARPGHQRGATPSQSTVGPITGLILDDLGLYDDLIDVFIAEYLEAKLSTGTELPARTRSVIETLRRSRKKADGSGGSDD